MCAGPAKSGQNIHVWLLGVNSVGWELLQDATFRCHGNHKPVEMAEEATHTVSDGIVTKFAMYEDFLDSQITPTDLYYLEVC